MYKLEQTKIAQYAKLMELLKEIEYTGNTDLIVKLQLKFGKKVQLVSKNFPQLNQSHLEWFMRVGHSKSIDELFDYLKLMPRDIPPHTFGKVWRKIIVRISRRKTTIHIKPKHTYFKIYCLRN